MAGANILAAIGAAMQQGVGTYNRLSEDERQRALIEQERQDRLRQQAIQNQQHQESMTLNRQQFEAAEAERKRRQIAEAIEGLNPNQIVSRSTFDAAKDIGLGDRFNVQRGMPSITGQLGLGEATEGNPLGLSTAPAVTEGQDVITRRPSLKEQGELTEQANAAADRARVEQFRSHLTSPEHAKEDFDTQTREAFANGINNMPISSSEFDRRQGLEHKNRLAEIAASTQWHTDPNRLTPAGGKVDPMLAKWVATKNQVADNIRAGAQGALNNAQSFEESMAIMKQIDEAAEAETAKLLGPKPNVATTTPGVTTGPQPGPQAASGDPVEKFMADNAAHIQQNPAAAIEEVRNAQIPVEIKKAILARLLSQQKPSQPNATGTGAAINTLGRMFQR